MLLDQSTSPSLKPLPTVSIRLLQSMGDADASIKDVVDIIKIDPAIAAKLLSVANSAKYGLSKEVTQVERAAALLGKSTITAIALTFSLSPNDKISEDAQPYYQAYWRESIMQATACEMIADDLGTVAKTEAFTAGLLADISRAWYLSEQPEEYIAVMKEAAENERPTYDVEADRWGKSHAAKSAELLEEWKLPPSYVTPARLHHAMIETVLRNSQQDDYDLQRILLFAAVLTEYFTVEAKGKALERVWEYGDRLFGFNNSKCDQYADHVLAKVAESADMFNLNASDIPEPGQLMSMALTRLAEFTAHQQQAALMAEAAADQARQEADELNRKLETVQNKSQIDGLTGVLIRDAFSTRLKARIEECIALEKAIGLVFVDVDRFKQVNDTYGHLAGDAVLIDVAKALSDETRDSDIVGRYGGDEFVIIASAKKIEGMRILCERLRKRVNQESFRHDGEVLRVTISIGGVMATPVDDPESVMKLLIAAADRAMYGSKTDGRNAYTVIDLGRIPDRRS